MSMPATTPPWYPVEERQRAILDFILWFSRFEYALKNSMFHKVARGYLEPDWAALKKSIKQKPIPLSLREVLVLLATNPPNKQTDHYTWVPVTGDADWPLLIEALKTVRNNLFHGGKHFPGELLSPNRDLTLINHGLLVMHELIQIVPEHVQVVFDHS